VEAPSKIFRGLPEPDPESEPLPQQVFMIEEVFFIQKAASSSFARN
jgi:hypothetical protein